jgi:outer membrane lipoprotein
LKRRRALPAVLALAVALGACATGFDVGDAERGVTPRAAAENLAPLRGRVVAWGGTVVASRNLADRTELEVLAYPLDRANRPQRDAEPAGRFIAVHTGYLETADYAAGRALTAVGTVRATRAGTVGEARYLYPVLVVTRLQLWPKDPAPSEPRVHFGIGISR